MIFCKDPFAIRKILMCSCRENQGDANLQAYKTCNQHSTLYASIAWEMQYILQVPWFSDNYNNKKSWIMESVEDLR